MELWRKFHESDLVFRELRVSIFYTKQSEWWYNLSKPNKSNISSKISNLTETRRQKKFHIKFSRRATLFSRTAVQARCHFYCWYCWSCRQYRKITDKPACVRWANIFTNSPRRRIEMFVEMSLIVSCSCIGRYSRGPGRVCLTNKYLSAIVWRSIYGF